MRNARLNRTVLMWAVCSLAAATGAAQELTPRAYWPAPKGTRVAIIGYSYAFGDVATDPSLPVFGVDSKINTGFLAFFKTVNLWGRTSNILVELPYSQGTTVGTLDGEPATRDFSGIGDLGITLSVNLLGAPTCSATLGSEQPSPCLSAAAMPSR